MDQVYIQHTSFLLHSVGENPVIWPYLTAKEAGMGGLVT